MFWNCHIAFATMGLNNRIIILALRTLIPSFLSTSNPSLSLTGWWLEAWLGLSMSPTSPCASAWQRGSPCRRCPRGVWPVPGASWSLAGGPRGRSRHTSCRRSWGCRQGTVRAPPGGWTPAAAAEGGNRMGWCAPAVANWARIWCWCSGWCLLRGWSPEVADLHHYSQDKRGICDAQHCLLVIIQVISFIHSFIKTHYQ